MKTGIIFPMAAEMGDFPSRLGGLQTEKRGMFTFYKGTWGAAEIIAVVCGICKTNAASATALLIERYGAERIIVCGVAGALDKTLHTGDTVIVTETAHHDIAPGFIDGEFFPHLDKTGLISADSGLLEEARRILVPAARRGRLVFGRVVTGEAFIKDEGRQRITEAFSPLGVDMETASAAQTCLILGTPWMAIRSISDTETEGYDENVLSATDVARNELTAFLNG